MTSARPSHINFRWLEDDDFLAEYALRTHWTAFEAACLLSGMQPLAVEGDGMAIVGREPEPQQGESYEGDPANDTLAQRVISLTDTLSRNWRGAADAPAQDIVRWAVANYVIPPRSFLANRLLPENAPPVDDSETLSTSGACPERGPKVVPRDGRGGHAADKRQHILGAALRALGSEAVRKKTVKGGVINAAELAKHIDDFGFQYGIPDGNAHGYSSGNIVKTIRDALRLARGPDPTE